MFRGFYTAGSGMIAQQRRTEMLANNMANANTPGFKAEQSTIRSFPEMYLSSIGKTDIPVKNPLHLKGLKPVGPVSTGVYMQETLPLFVQGQLRETGLTTDMSLVDGALPANPETGRAGTVLFRLENENGQELYTRNGNLTLDAQGYLTNPDGYYVLDTGGQRIQLPNDDFRVTQDGGIMVGGAQAARLGIAYAAQPETLMKQGNGLYQADGNLPDAPNAGYSLQQGYVEGSNVDAGMTMTDMLSAYRAFEANQKILQAYDRSMEKAVTEVGRVNG